MSKLKCFLQPIALPCCSSFVMLLLRLIVGLAFVQHGWGKIQNPFGWMPPDAGVPGFFQFLAALAEFGGGIALILGLLTSLAMLGLAITMLVATSMHAFVMKDPMVTQSQGGSSFELPLVYLGISLLIMSLGAGKYSLDAKMFGTRSCDKT